ncbi:uncharacterized protein LOC122459859 [Dermochelys coriacea]|uniref:uncharacterized protein LOC122459859 n=1 Tax=Dermochelys coriacea TaxID=27794 RepID=UPI001CA7BA6A|nr:uncharacterized protein LOC122459859 [Dermochelys coriacea]
MDTSEREEEEQESGIECAGAGGDTLESLEARSQELFSSQEAGSQSQRPVLGGGQTEEQVPDATLRSQQSMLSLAERLQKLRKRSRKSKGDMLQEVMQQSLKENQKVQLWRESESRIHQENTVHWRQSTELRQQSANRLISIMECQADSIQALVAMQAEHYCARPSLQPLSQNSFPCAPMSPPTHFPQHPGSYRQQLPPTPVASPPIPENYDPYPLYSTPILNYSHPEVQHSLHSTPDRKAEYENRTYANL